MLNLAHQISPTNLNSSRSKNSHFNFYNEGSTQRENREQLFRIPTVFEHLGPKAVFACHTTQLHPQLLQIRFDHPSSLDFQPSPVQFI